MSPFERLVDFGVCIGIPDSRAVSFTNRFVVKPIDWLIGKEETGAVSQFICRHIIARIVALSTSAFALLDVAYNGFAAAGKLPLAALAAAGVIKIDRDYTFDGILDNLKNGAQSCALAFTGTIMGVARPEKLRLYAYPLSEKHKSPIFGYHEVSPDVADAWTISPQLFEKHLQHLYDNNYELCTFAEFLNGYKAANGKKLAVITFDDSHESQFRYIEDPQGTPVIDETCALGVFEKFKKDHPDFRCVATFYINTSEDAGSSGEKHHQIFAATPDQKPFTAKKLRYLLDQGHEIAAHGHLHRRFDKLTQEEIEEDIRLFDEAIEQVIAAASGEGIDLSDLDIQSFAWPHGLVPSNENRKPIDKRFKNIADFGFSGSKVRQADFAAESEACKKVSRIYVGPNTGFEQYAP